jgi:hypothetical protein
VPREHLRHLPLGLGALVVLADRSGRDRDAARRDVREQRRVGQRDQRAEGVAHDRDALERERVAHAVVEARMADVVIQCGIAGRRRAAGAVGIDQVDGEAVGEQLRVVAQQARAEPGAALEVQQRLATTHDLVAGAAAVGQLERLTQRRRRTTLADTAPHDNVPLMPPIARAWRAAPGAINAAGQPVAFGSRHSVVSRSQTRRPASRRRVTSGRSPWRPASRPWHGWCSAVDQSDAELRRGKAPIASGPDRSRLLL